MKNARALLSYDQVEPLFLREMRSERARAKFKALSFLSEEEEKKERSDMLDAEALLNRIDLPLEVSFDLTGYAERAYKGGELTPEELYRCKNESDNREKICKAFSSEDLPHNGLLLLARGLPELLPLGKAIDRAVGADLKVKDKASGKLYAIRMSLRGIDGEMKAALEKERLAKAEYLSSPLPSMRNGKMVLAVKNAYKSKVSGAILASSASGETIFVEPMALLALEDKRERLLHDEKEEVERILRELSGLVAFFSTPLLDVNEGIARLDFAFGKVRYMNRVKGSIPEVKKGKELRLKKARHPLLFEKAVPNDFSLSAAQPILVISGPNAGGKTVALKTVGLLSYMARLGLPIPAEEGSIVPMYREIAADIGDQQSLEESLSTFSGHLSGLRDAIKDVGPDSLLLLDELGTGTAPKEGEAIAYGVISYLEKRGAEAVVSSHFEGIKALAVSGGEVRNASMAYDEATSSPTYRLRMDVPGESYGLSLAKRYLPPEVVEDAASYLRGEVEDSLEGALRKLTEATSRVEEKEKELALQNEEFRKKEAAFAAERARLQRSSEDVANREKALKKDLLASYEKKIEAIIKALNPNSKLHEAIKAKKDIEALFDDFKAEEPSASPIKSEPLQVGDYCLVESLGLEGRVERAGKRLEIRTSSGALFKVDPSLCSRGRAPKERKEPMNGRLLDDVSSLKSLPLEINLIGMRAAEAESALDNYVDKAILKGFGRVRIIHGFGSGVLRHVVEEYARAHPERVKRFEGAGEKEGMGGATIYYLK